MFDRNMLIEIGSALIPLAGGIGFYQLLFFFLKKGSALNQALNVSLVIFYSPEKKDVFSFDKVSI